MRRLIAIFMLSLTLVTHSELGQLLKLPTVYIHFLQHKQENGKLSFAQFVTLHYNSGSGAHSKDIDHSRLPFKNSDLVQSGFILNVPVLPATINMSLQPPIGACTRFISHDQQFGIRGYDKSIFQPPRKSVGICI